MMTSPFMTSAKKHPFQRLTWILTLCSFALITGLLGACSEKKSSLEEIITKEILGMDLAYLEQFTGASRSTLTEGAKLYEYKGCRFEVTHDKTSITGFTVNLTPECSFDLNPFLLGDDKIEANQLTFGSFYDEVGPSIFLADCVEHYCGNAFDPSLYLHWRAPRARQFIEVMISSTEFYNYSDLWLDTMRQTHDDEWMMYAKFNCPNVALEYRDIALEAFRNLPIQKVQIGYNLLEQTSLQTDCEELYSY